MKNLEYDIVSFKKVEYIYIYTYISDEYCRWVTERKLLSIKCANSIDKLFRITLILGRVDADIIASFCVILTT